MPHYITFFLALAALVPVQGQTSTTAGANALVQKIQGELSVPVKAVDAKTDTKIPQGEFIHGKVPNSAIYPSSGNEFQVYVPTQYDPAKPACLLIKLDGFGNRDALVLDDLIAKKDVPVMIGIGIVAGQVWKPKRPLRMNRSFEFDSMNDHFSDFVLNELLPAVRQLKTRDGRIINLSSDGNDHAVTGASTGGIGAFTLAWLRPDQFTRVYSVVGTFVSMRGGNEYPALVRKTEPKPIRIFLEDGSSDSWNPIFGSWFDANLNMESALTFAGYDVAHAWGVHGHDGRPGWAIFPDVMRWLWRDYPAPIKTGTSKNGTLVHIFASNSGWQKISQSFQGASGLATNGKGDVYLSDSPASMIYRLGPDDNATVFCQHASRIAGECFGPDGRLYGVVPDEKKVIAVNSQGAIQTITDGIAGRSIVVTHQGILYVSEPGEHSDMPSRIWRIGKNGEKKIVDEGLLSVSGVAFSPDGNLFFAAEKSTRWIYSYVVQSEDEFTNKQPFYWLHITDIPSDSGAEDIALDAQGTLYVATRMGIQVCDQNGRVRAILSLPTPCGPVRSLCFGGEHLDTLYATDGKQVFKRTLKVSGCMPWAEPTLNPREGP